MGKRRSQSRHVSKVQWRRVNTRALRLAAFSFLLPVPVALAAPQSSTLPTEQLVAMSQVPVSGVGDTVLPRVLPVRAAADAGNADPAASVTRLAKGEKAAAFSPSEVAANGIPAAALRAYRTAEATMAVADPSCRLSWGLLAGVGRVESDHGRYGGAVLGQNGVSTPQILGLPLNGVGPVAAISDTDGGALDGDRQWDRAVGPMQFIPSTWAMVGVDGDGDGQRNPHDVDDAALAAAAYLCVGDNDLSTATGLHDAVYSYNHSDEYVAMVVGVAHAYERGIVDLPLLEASLQLPTGPGVNVGLSHPGGGVMIGASDEVTDRADGRRGHGSRDQDGQDDKGNKGDRAEQPGQDRKAAGGPGADAAASGKGDKGKRAGDAGGDDVAEDTTGGTGGTGSTDSGDTGKKADRKQPKGGSGGTGSEDDSTSGGNETNKPADGGEESQDQADEDNSGSNSGSGTGGGHTTPPAQSGPGDSPEDDEADAGKDTDAPVEPTEPPTEEPAIGHEFDHGVLAYCDESQATLCLADAEDNIISDPLDADPATYAPLVDSEVTVIYHSEDGGDLTFFDIVEGTTEQHDD